MKLIEKIPFYFAGPPLVDGGSDITEYIIEMANSEQEERRQVYQGAAPECTVCNLLPGRMYCFWLRAANRVGVSALLTEPGFAQKVVVVLSSSEPDGVL